MLDGEALQVARSRRNYFLGQALLKGLGIIMSALPSALR